MRVLFLGVGYLITIGFYILFSLLPYYIAYIIIEPESFFGIVGVFFLGSIIVPLIIFFGGMAIGAIGLSFSALAQRETKNEVHEIRIVNEVKSKKNSKIIFMLSFFLILSIGVIIYLVIVQKMNDENNYSNQESNTVYELVGVASDVDYTTDTITEETYPNVGDEIVYETDINDSIGDKKNLDFNSPNLQTLGPSHLSLNVWFKDDTGSKFDIDFKNNKRPEINSAGSCHNVKSDLEKTSRFSTLINKELNIHSIYECNNNMIIEVSTFIENNESHLIMTLSQRDNPNRIFYSGEMSEN